MIFKGVLLVYLRFINSAFNSISGSVPYVNQSSVIFDYFNYIYGSA